MSKKLNILLVILSVFVLLILPNIPHHHHGSSVCVGSLTHDIVNEAATDCHTHHESSNTNDGNTCIEDATYIISNARNNNEEEHVIDLLDLFLFCQYELLLSLDFSSDHTFIKHYLSRYHSVDIHKFNGLRAPPVYLS